MKINSDAPCPLFSPASDSKNPSLLEPQSADSFERSPFEGLRKRPSRRHGFTLVELMVVISIATVLISMAANVAQDVVESNQITQAGEMISDELKLARYTAITQDRVVEVRFYKPTAADSFGGDAGVTSLQTFIFDQDNAKAKALREVRHLPGAVRVSEDATLSSLIVPARAKSDWKTGDEQITLPEAGTDYTAYRVRFLPNGGTDLDAQQLWFLTVHGRRNYQSLPDNYVTIQVKPSRGSIRTFRP